MSPVTKSQKFTRANPCPICDGCESDPRGKERRCPGYMSPDGEYAHCCREEHAGAIEPTSANPPTYAHRMHGDCRCGTTHGQAHERAAEGEYDYTSETGAVLYQVVRFARKTFRQRRPDGAGGWIWSIGDVRRVPYHLPQLLAAAPARTVYLVEGEKDVESLERIGEVATTTAQGAKSWRFTAEEAARALKGRRVVIIADADQAGREYALAAYDTLRPVTASVSHHECPEPHKDVSDLLGAGGTLAELVPMRSVVTEPERTPRPPKDPPREPWENGPPEGLADDRAEDPASAPEPSRIEERAVLVTSEWFADEPPPVDWLLWDSRTERPAFVRGTLGLLIAAGGVGKTMIAVNLALCVASGTRWLGVFDVRQGRVLLLVAEEDLAEMKRRVYYGWRGKTPPPSGQIEIVPLSGVTCALIERKDPYSEPALTQFATDLAAYIEKHGPFELVIIDPMSAFSSLDTERSNSEATRFMVRCQEIGNIANASVILTHHSSQAGRVRNVKVDTDAARGVTGITDRARWVATLSVDKLDPDNPNPHAPATAMFGDLDETITFQVTKANGVAKSQPVELCRDPKCNGLLRALDVVEREIVARRRDQPAAKATEKKIQRERAEAERAVKEAEARALKATTAKAARADEFLRQERALVDVLAAHASGILSKPLRAAMAARLDGCTDTTRDDTIARLGDAVRVEPAPKNGRLHVLMRDKLPSHLRSEEPKA